MVKKGRYLGLSEIIGQGTFTFIVLAACEVGEVHTNIGEMQSIAQGLANLRGCTVWGTTRDLPQLAVAQGTALYKSPVFQWLQPDNTNFHGMWKCFEKQTELAESHAMMSNLNLNSV
jgi:hypothetical protein